MSLDLGDLADLATALGLLDDKGGLVTDWFMTPGTYLTRILRNDAQRTALLTVASDLLEAGAPLTDAQGRRWVPVVAVPGGELTLCLVVAGGSGQPVEIGAGARLQVHAASQVGLTGQVFVPLFAQPADGSAAVLLPGTPGAAVLTSLALTLPPDTATGGVDLAGATLEVDVPTHSGDLPRFAIGLTGLRLPGAAAPTDLRVDADGIEALGTSLLHLVLGLLRAEAADAATGPVLRGFAGLLGLGADAVPDFPIDAVLAQGPGVLADWLATTLGDPATRTAWLAALAGFVGGTADATGVTLAVGAATVTLGLAVAPVAGGQPRVTPTITARLAPTDQIALVLEVDPVALDLGTGSAVAVPALQVTAQLGNATHPLLDTTITDPAVHVHLDALHAGFALDDRRRPLLVLAARNAVVGTQTFPVLDLTSPAAISTVGQDVLSTLAAGLATKLSPFGALLGLPTDLAAPPELKLDPAALLHDPLGALAGFWNGVLTGPHAADLLALLRDTLGGATQAVTGTGMAADPWRVPLTAGVDLTVRYLAGVLVAGVAAQVTAPDLAGVAVALTAEITLVELGGLAPGSPRRAVFLPAAEGGLRFTAAGGGRLRAGSAPLALSADALGLGLTWSTGTTLTDATARPGLHLSPVAEGVQLAADTGAPVTLTAPTLAADGTLTWNTAAWAAVETLAAAAAGALAATTGSSWPQAVTRALGWGAATDGPHLALADLVTAPAQALQAYAAQILDVATADGPFTLLLDVLAELLGTPTGRSGSGRPDEPWRLPLLTGATGAAADVVPALLAALGPAGPVTAATTLARGGVAGWSPGDPDLPAETLLAAISSESTIDAGLRDLLADRGDLVAGFGDLVARLVGTDGLVTLPETGLPDRLLPFWAADLPHATRLDGVDLGPLGLPAGATLVFVAVAGPGQPDVLPPVAADHAVDLTGANRPPSSFTAAAPADAAGPYAITLGTRADCRLPAGDPDGVGGQAARLAAVLPALPAAGPVVLVAHGGAGHAAVRACAGLANAPAAVVTVGTPWSAVAVDTLDRVPGAEALRLLAALLPAPPAADEQEEDPDLALARGLLTLWLGLDPLPDPLAELGFPGSPTDLSTAPPVHAVVGTLGEPTIRQALTAAVAAGLAGRALNRAAVALPAPQVTTAGLRLPLLPAAAHGGLAPSLLLDLESGGPRLVLRFALGADPGWLVGGPDPGRTPGLARPLALRRLTAEVALPLHGGVASARLDLHDATALGVSHPLWTVATGPEAPAGATSTVPEVRALLAEVAARLVDAPADPVVAALRDGLTALGLLSTGGASGTVGSPATALGVDPVTLVRLVTDPAGTATAVLADPGRRAALAAAVRALAGDTRSAADAGDTVAVTIGGDPVGVRATLDLAARQVRIGARGTTGVGWAVDVATSPAFTITARIGTDLPAIGDRDVPQGAALLVTAGDGELTVDLRIGRPGAVTDVALWPAPDPAAMARALAAGAPALLLHALLQALRERLRSAAFDLVLDALGLLAAAPPLPAGADPTQPPPPRPLRLPAGLVADPGAWLRGLGTGTANLTTLVPQLLDAVTGLLGLPATPGSLPLAPGVTLRTTVASGRLELSVAVAEGGLTGGQLSLAGSSAGLSLDPANPLGPGVRPAVTLALTRAGLGSANLGVGPRADGTVGVTLSVAPGGGVAIPILPAGPGLLAGLAEAGAFQALRVALDAIAEQATDAGAAAVPKTAGQLVAGVGDALGLSTGGVFDEAALSTFGHDPAAGLATRAATLAGPGLAALVAAVQPLVDEVTPLPAGMTFTVAAADSALRVTVGPVTVAWAPGTAGVTATIGVDPPEGEAGLAGVRRLVASATVDGSGLTALDVEVGPAEIDAGPLVLRPFAAVRAGSAPAGGRAVEIGLGAGADTRFAVRIGLAGEGVALVASTGDAATATESTDPAHVALAAVGAVLDLAGSVVLAVPAVAAALARPILSASTTPGKLLTGVLLTDADPPRLDPDLLDVGALLGAGGVLDPAELLRRLRQLLANLAAGGEGFTVPGTPLTLTVAAKPGTTLLGLQVSLTGPLHLAGDDLTVALEVDDHWITPSPGPGLTLWLLELADGGAVKLAPELTVGGVGVRLARASGPLLATVITIETVGLSLYADVAAPGGAVAASGGARVELAGLAVGLGGGTGGDNPVASGLLAGGGGADAPRPRFSPAVAVQKHATAPTLVTLSAGDGTGPWWLVIQRGFGPIYIEEIGFAVTMSGQQLASVGLLVDGRVSLLGLTATVDELSVTWLIAVGSPLDSHAWAVDLAGLAVTADLSGISLAGGLRKVPSNAGGTEYLGMLLARFGVYGLSAYGGYGLVGPANDTFASLFLFGAVNGPIGGPPAFFVTGIGGGFGINRALTYPSDLSQFASYPLVKALDPAARPGDPMAELEQIRGYFPAQRGTFWFAAGLSFTSFALVDGVAVVAVQIGDGFELSLLGLARMALPRPDAALVSVELALLARVSSRQGVVLVQAQLTDNSWLLFPTVRLTGGFAFAAWFGGPNRGQFVLTMGGYHPSFHRDGYPVVPRLGIDVELYGFISITGASYFALTSEAVMAGASLTVSAQFGPAWAHLTVGGDGIVFFDPFWFDVTVYASISAGISIDVWIGTITISVSLSAQVELSGPPFHGKASFSVGPADLTVEFGDQTTSPQPLDWAAFVPKYLQEAGQGVAAVLAAITGQGAVVPAGAAASGAARSPDGSAGNPFLVAPEFTLTVTSLAPIRRLIAGSTTRDLPTVLEISAAPMRAPATPTVTLTLTDGKGVDHAGSLQFATPALGAFAIGAWGPAPSQDSATVPRGDVITAVDRVVITAEATVPAGTNPIRANQVDVAGRRVLPFVTEGAAAQLAALARAAAQLAALVPPVEAGSTVTQVAAGLLAERAGRSPADVLAWRGDRVSLPYLGSLAEGLGQAGVTIAREKVPPPPPPVPAPLRPPLLRALLAAPVGPGAVPATVTGAGVLAGAPADPPAGVTAARGQAPATTVSMDLLARFPVDYTTAPPKLADIDRGVSGAVPATLLRIPDPAAAVGSTVLATGAVPPSRSGRSGVELVAGRGQDPASAAHLTGLAGTLQDGGMPIAAGSVAVLALPDADRDVDPTARPRLAVTDGSALIVAVGPGGQILAHRELVTEQAVTVPPGARVIAVHPLGAPPAAGLRVLGWDAATPLPYLGDEVLLAAGAVVASSGRVPWRRALRVRTGWVAPDGVVDGPAAVTTRFAAPVTAVAVALEGGAGDADLALGLDGATRATSAGSVTAPVLVADGPRAVAVFGVVPDDPAGAVSVTVTAGPQRRLAGVAAVVSPDHDGGVAALAAAFAARGYAEVVPDPVPTGTAGATVTWEGPDADPA